MDSLPVLDGLVLWGGPEGALTSALAAIGAVLFQVICVLGGSECPQLLFFPLFLILSICGRLHFMRCSGSFCSGLAPAGVLHPSLF